MNSLRVLIADDHEVVRRGIRALLEANPKWEVCGEAATGREAIENARKLCPDLVLLDINMPDMDGLETIPRILEVCSDARILVLTMHDSAEIATNALAAGASGLVLKSDAAHDLVMAVQVLAEGKPFLSPAVTKTIMEQLVKVGKPGPSPSDLTPRELEILKLLAHGRSHKEIAYALDISVKTVDAHCTNIMRKLNLHALSDLIHFAIRHKIVEI
jgi:DNA-binding NarL/FixJ family response regulator